MSNLSVIPAPGTKATEKHNSSPAPSTKLLLLVATFYRGIFDFVRTAFSDPNAMTLHTNGTKRLLCSTDTPSYCPSKRVRLPPSYVVESYASWILFSGCRTGQLDTPDRVPQTPFCSNSTMVTTGATNFLLSILFSSGASLAFSRLTQKH